jgi:hypothetical protein
MFHTFRKKQSLNFVFVILLVSLFALLLGACSGKHLTKQNSTEKKSKDPQATVNQQKWKLPITIPKGEFYKVAGWLGDNEILYVTNIEQTSDVYRYDLRTGKSKLLYQSSYPIATVQISPSRKSLLIQSSPSTYQGLITITDITGKEIMEQSLTAYELGFEWNPYNEAEILVSKFSEDWTYQMFLINIKNKTSTGVELPQPFIKWMGKGDVAYLNYNQNQSELFAPLLEKKLTGTAEETLFPSVYQFSAFYNMLMTITVNKEDPSKAAYYFYDKDKKSIFHFSVPQLSKFSDWLVPFYDYNENKRQFISLTPLESGEVDSYTEGFDLNNYDLKKGSNELILKGLKNLPLEFSPSGEMCLYGNGFEKLINLKRKTIVDLVKE